MTEQTDAAEVGALAEALLFGVAVGDVEAGRAFRESIARRILASDWLAADRAAQRRLGAEAVVAAAEKVTFDRNALGWALAAARAAAQQVEGDAS